MYDLAAFARMCTPIDDDSCDGLGWRLPVGEPSRQRLIAGRLRLVADAYGATATQRGELFVYLATSIAHGGRFLARRIAAGDANFAAMWTRGGGMARFDRRREWFARAQDESRSALV